MSFNQLLYNTLAQQVFLWPNGEGIGLRNQGLWVQVSPGTLFVVDKPFDSTNNTEAGSFYTQQKYVISCTNQNVYSYIYVL